MKKRTAIFRAALLLFSLILILLLIGPKKGKPCIFFFLEFPGISAPVCIILAITAYAFYYFADRSDSQH